MLRSLYIRDYALIEELEVEFDSGLNIITGETGAGKSILLGALKLLLGERASTEALRTGAKKAIIEGVDEITKVTVIEGRAPASADGVKGSPFAIPWEDAGPVTAVPAGGVIATELDKASVLLTQMGGEVKAYPNACAHLGMPLEMGEVSDGVITCSYHGFQFRLDTGECLTTPEIALPSYPVRVQAGRVQVQVTT